MKGLHPDLLTVLNSVEILAPSRYRLLGQDVRDLAIQTTPAATIASPGAAAPGDSFETGPAVIVSALAQELYTQLYIRPSNDTRTGHDLLAGRDLVAALSTANAGQGTWEPGWTIGEVDDDGRVAVTKDGLTFWVPPTGLRTEGQSS